MITKKKLVLAIGALGISAGLAGIGLSQAPAKAMQMAPVSAISSNSGEPPASSDGPLGHQDPNGVNSQVDVQAGHQDPNGVGTANDKETTTPERSSAV